MRQPPPRVVELAREYGELWEERAAIREYDGGQARKVAEERALEEILVRVRAQLNRKPR